MMPYQFASMDMGGITAEPSAMDLFPGTSAPAPDLTATTIASQLDAGQLASRNDGFVLRYGQSRLPQPTTTTRGRNIDVICSEKKTAVPRWRD